MMKQPRGLRFYQQLLHALPPDMRERFGSDMEDVLRLRLRETGGSRLRTAAVWLRAVCDVATQAIALRFEERGGDAMRLGSIVQDVRYALRGVRTSPALAVLAILTLGLGIAASTATFSVVRGVLLEGLPFEEPDRLVVVWPEVNANKAMTLMAEQRMSSLEAVAGLSPWTLTLTGVGEPRELTGVKVSTNYFDILGVRPLLGRAFASEEDLPGAAGVVVLSHTFWTSAFGADPTVLDQSIDLGGADYDRRRIIGVMPPGADDFLQDIDVWIPLEGDPALGLEADDTWYVNVRVARLAPGATLAQANAEVREYAAAVQSRLPAIYSREEAQEASVREIREYVTRDVRASIWIAQGAVGLVLLIGCFNVANLLLARGDRRRRDLAVRTALGAGRTRLTRMLLTEAGILGISGGLLGVGAAYGLVGVIVSQAPENLPGLASITVSPMVLAFAIAATLFSTIIAGLVPAVRAARMGATSAVGGGSRGAALNGASRLTPALVGGQIALEVIVTIGSGLMLRTLSTLLAVDPGIDGANVMAFKPVPPAGRYPDGASFREYYRQVAERVAALPFVESVGAIHLLPGNTNNWSFPTYPQGYNLDEQAPTPSVNFRAVRGEYFELTRVPIRAGRVLTTADSESSEPVVVVNETFVAEYWPDDNPIGRSLSIFSANGTRYRVVGVVADVHQHGLELDPFPEMYFSHEQVPWDQMSMWVLARVASGAAGPQSWAATLREAVWAVDTDVPITGMAHLSDVLTQSTRGTRFVTMLLSSFGGLALVLCAVGVFGVTSYSSGRRRAEFGVRLALGSSQMSILRSAVARGLLPVGVGLAVGLLAASFASGLLESVLFGVSASDPLTFVTVTVVLALTAVIASIVPAWRASRVDPAAILASE